MNKLFFGLLLLSFFSSCQSDTQKKSVDPKTSAIEESATSADIQGVSFALGALITKDLKSIETKVDFDLIYKALQDVLENRPLDYPEEQMFAAMTDSSSTLYKERSYAMGYSMGNNFKAQNLGNVLIPSFRKGSQAVLNNDSLPYTEEEMGSLISTFQQNLAQEKGVIAKKDGIAFLAQNATDGHVKITASGLQYKIIKAGAGKKPQANDEVLVHYTGKLVDGTVFDSSVERGEPAQFGVSQVIQGWIEGIQLMSPGSKFQFFIPYGLGYGAKGNSNIPPYSALIFDVELLKVIPTSTPTAPPPTYQKK